MKSLVSVLLLCGGLFIYGLAYGNDESVNHYRDASKNTFVTLGTTISGEDVTNDVMKVEQRFTYTNITLAAPTCTVVKSGPGYLQALTFNKPTATGVTTIYDNTACSGTIIGTITTPTAPMPLTLFYHITFGTGLSINTATAAQDITVSSR